MKDGQLVSGGMAHRKNYTYGKYEFRVRTEKDSTLATSGVVLTWPQSGKWPADGELVFTINDKEAIPHVAHHLCIQLDAFKQEMTGIVKMYVDWMKIYQQSQ